MLETAILLGKTAVSERKSRCGGMVDATDLKSVLAKSGVWVRLPSSAPSKMPALLGDSLGSENFVDCERSRTKTRENTVYPSSIRQVLAIYFHSTGSALSDR